MGGANFWGGTKEDDVSLKACFKMFSKMHNGTNGTNVP